MREEHNSAEESPDAGDTNEDLNAGLGAWINRKIISSRIFRTIRQNRIISAVIVIAAIVICAVLGLAAVTNAVKDIFTNFGQFAGFTQKEVAEEITQTSNSITARHYILPPQSEKLLSLIHKWQGASGSTKLIVSYDGSIFFKEKAKREKHRINLIEQLFDIEHPDLETGRSSHWDEFENLLVTIPAEFIRVLPTNLVGCAYTVTITQKGIEYLGGSTKASDISKSTDTSEGES